MFSILVAHLQLDARVPQVHEHAQYGRIQRDHTILRILYCYHYH